MRSSTRPARTTTGEVTLRLYKGNIEPVSRKSPYSLYSLDIASFTMGAEYDQKDARGFINLIGLPIQVRARLEAGAKAAKKPNEALGRTVRGRAVGSLRALLRIAPFRPAADRCRYPRLAGLRAGSGARRHPDRGGARADRRRRSMRSAPKPPRPSSTTGATDEDVHTLVIRKLKERAGALADKIHTGRSRNEQVSLDTRLWLREEMRPRARAAGAASWRRCSTCAGRYPDAVIPGYTHMRRAQAVLWPHYLLAYFEMFARDCERFGEARAPRQCSAARLAARWPAAAFPSTARPSRAIWASPASPATAWTSRATAISRSIFSMPHRRPCCT